MYTEEYLNVLVDFLKNKINLVNDTLKREVLENTYNKLMEIRKIEELERKESLELAEKEMAEFLNL
jgi:hypothetical protein